VWALLVTSPAKRKGSAFERLIVDTFRNAGYEVDRTRAGWSDDRGDVHGINHPVLGNFTVECKNQKAMDLSGWLTELERERVANGGGLGAVVHKKRGTGEGDDQYATLPLWMLVQLLKEAGYK
jgi:hypothetical protein